MAQRGYPIQELDFQWEPSEGVDIPPLIDEPVGADDGKEMIAHTFEFDLVTRADLKLAPLIDPLVHTGHTIRVRAKNDGVPHSEPSAWLQVELCPQTGTGVAGSSYAGFNILSSALRDDYQTFTYTLDAPVEANAINNYTNLHIRITAHPKPQTVGGEPPYEIDLFVESVEFEIPDAGFVHLDIDPTGPGFKEVPTASGNYLVLDGPGFRRVTGIEGAAAAGTVLVKDPTGPGFKVQ